MTMSSVFVQTTLFDKPDEEKNKVEVQNNETSLIDLLLHRIKWSNVIVVIVWHCLFVYSYYYFFNNPILLPTIIFSAFISLFGGMGIVLGKSVTFYFVFIYFYKFY